MFSVGTFNAKPVYYQTVSVAFDRAGCQYVSFALTLPIKNVMIPYCNPFSMWFSVIIPFLKSLLNTTGFYGLHITFGNPNKLLSSLRT